MDRIFSLASPYRHSRASGNPENPDGSMPVFACTVLDSRLRGNDGKGDWIIRGGTISGNTL